MKKVLLTDNREQTMPEIRMRDFSRTPRALEFDADGDHFVCYSDVPPTVLQDMLNLVDPMRHDFGLVAEFFDLAMPKASADLARKRLNSAENPLSLVQALEIATWLIEEHSQRPLAQSENSSDG